MGTRLLLLVALVAGMTSSCATQKLWKATDPDARVSISESDVSEAELQERGVPYRKDPDGTYLVGKSRSERLGDHALRAVFTPAAMCVDAVPYLALISAQVFLGYPVVEFDGKGSPKLVRPPATGGQR